MSLVKLSIGHVNLQKDDMARCSPRPLAAASDVCANSTLSLRSPRIMFCYCDRLVTISTTPAFIHRHTRHCPTYKYMKLPHRLIRHCMYNFSVQEQSFEVIKTTFLFHFVYNHQIIFTNYYIVSVYEISYASLSDIQIHEVTSSINLVLYVRLLGQRIVP